MSFVMVPTWLAQADINPQSLRVWIILGSYGTFNVNTGCYESIFPAVETAAERAGVSASTFRRCLAELETLGALKRIARYDPEQGRQLSNIYQLKTGTLVPPPPGEPSDPSESDTLEAGRSDRGSLADLPANQEPITYNHKTQSSTAPPPAPPTRANEILATLIDACAAAGITLTPRIKGMYAKKFKELLDGSVPPELILSALRLSWKKRTLDRVQLLDNYLIEVQAGERVRDVRTKTEVRSEGVRSLIDQAEAVVKARGGNPNDNRLMSKTMRDIRDGLIDVAQALGSSFTQLQIGAA